SLRAHPHLQFSAGACHRPPHQPHVVSSRGGDGGRSGRTRRRPDPRTSGGSARRTRRRNMIDTSTPDVASALKWAREHIDSVDARILMRRVLDCAATRLVSHPDLRLDAAEWEQFRHFVTRRASGEPVAYLVGEREFFGYSLMITPAVLIPRPETELLVELAEAHFAGRPNTRVLDLGTGSGAVAIALAKELPDADVTAVDRSREALLVAMANAARLRVSVSFVVSDWFASLAGDRFQLIVANPPYVAATDPHLG